jgi:hypothetical protein
MLGSTLKGLLVVPLIGACIQATAANYQGTVSHVMPYNGKVYIVIQNGSFDGAASACPFNGASMVYGIDLSNAFGHALEAVALSARLTGKLVYAVGDGNCIAGNPFAGSTSESLAGLDIKDQ